MRKEINDIYILGLNIGHNATASLLKNGEIISCMSEERISRIKNHYGIPFNSISIILSMEKILLKDITYIVLDDHYFPNANPYFVKRFQEDYTKKSIKNKFLSKIGYSFPKLFERYLNYKQKSRLKNQDSTYFSLQTQVSEILHFPIEKIKIIDHHLAHALSPCFNIPKDKKTLIFTLDGEGSGFCASVNIFNGSSIHTISKTSKSASLGYLYSLATIHLGMKPLEHEFKVMGLAPYAKKHNIEQIYSKFKDLIYIDSNLSFHSKFNMPFADHFLKKEMQFQRFDTISGAVQRLTEEILVEWIKKGIEKTGIKDIALSGGVFMNVKANLKISSIPEVKSIFIMPSSGDESNPFGCCYYGYELFCKQQKVKFLPKNITSLYLGQEYSSEYTEKLIKRKNLEDKYKIKRFKKINKEIAKLLSKGEIVARCSGKSEWGARALGNRSILANPKDGKKIKILNETIKDRDFWMPFTPSILDTYENKYLVNPKKIFSPYMIITFNSTKQAQKDLPAVMHPYDFTIRPQIVTKSYNPDYYEIISEFAKITGIGAILNTSFNLHGEPNVLTPEDALHTFENSDLKYLALGNILLCKKGKK